MTFTTIIQKSRTYIKRWCVPQGTSLGPLLFLIMIIDQDNSTSYKVVSIANGTRVYSCINDIEKCNQLQIDLNSVYDWPHVNNMC